jgi:hypothetical protein
MNVTLEARGSGIRDILAKSLEQGIKGSPLAARFGSANQM